MVGHHDAGFSSEAPTADITKSGQVATSDDEDGNESWAGPSLPPHPDVQTTFAKPMPAKPASPMKGVEPYTHKAKLFPNMLFNNLDLLSIAGSSDFCGLTSTYFNDGKQQFKIKETGDTTGGRCCSSFCYFLPPGLYPKILIHLLPPKGLTATIADTLPDKFR